MAGLPHRRLRFPLPTFTGGAEGYFFAGTAYNYLANLSGQPAVVLPCGFSHQGLPIGLQLVGKRWGEAKLLGVAKAVEKLLPPCPVPPNLA